MLFILLAAGLYVLWLNMPGTPINYEPYHFNISAEVYSAGPQFYPNMRYQNKEISYSISKSCDPQRQLDTKRAFFLISEKTILAFNEVKSGEDISILCSNLAPKPEERGHFVAGEGGPSEIINTSKYAIILSGKVSLFRPNTCKDPNIAIHEVLHALGFDHNTNKKSVMYPVTECDQEIDKYITDEINRLYSIESASDLGIESVNASKTGRYLSFDIVIGNFGIISSTNSSLVVNAEDQLAGDFSLGEIDVGIKKKLFIDNLRIPRDTDSLTFEVINKEKDLDARDNIARMRLAQ